MLLTGKFSILDFDPNLLYESKNLILTVQIHVICKRTGVVETLPKETQREAHLAFQVLGQVVPPVIQFACQQT